jgi:Gas vesicle protein
VSAADGEVALVDLLDRLLVTGAVLSGEITLTIADIDLVHISLRALVTSVTADLHRSPTSGSATDRD